MSIPLPALPAAAHRARAAATQRTELTALAGQRARVTIYGDIGGFWGEDTRELVEGIAAVTAPAIDVHLNSPGGSAFDGVAIYNALRGHAAHVTVHVEGLAASAASVVAMAGDTIEMGIGAQMMIHDASAVAYGNASEMAAMATALDSVSDSLASVYAHRAGGDVPAWREAMRAETWYTADEAVDAGLATTVAERGESADPEAAFDLTRFAHAGRSHAPAPAPRYAAGAPLNPSATGLRSTPSNERGSAVPLELSDQQVSDLRSLAGVSADATDLPTIIAGLREALDERAEPTATIALEAVLPEGAVVIESDVLDALRAQAAEGAAARQHQLVEARAALVEAAVRDGRIAPARREHWTAALTADPEGAQASLASLATGLIPVDGERGYAGQPDDGDQALDALTNALSGKVA